MPKSEKRVKMRRWQGLLLFLGLLMTTMLGACDELDSARLSYADGSGNVYLVAKNPEPYIQYQPVKPATSSSGTYDGGEPVTRAISQSRYAELLAAVQNAYAHTASHIPERVMMSGAVTLSSKGKEINFILKPGSPEQQQLEKLLKASLQGDLETH